MKKTVLYLAILCSAGITSCQKDKLSDLNSTADNKGIDFRRGDVGEAGGKCDDAVGNPFAPALDFGVFVEGDMTVYGKEQKTNLAVGGDLTLAEGATYNVGSNGIGTYKAGNDNVVTAAWIGGTINATNRLKVQGNAYYKVKQTHHMTSAVVSGNTKLYNAGGAEIATTGGGTGITMSQINDGGNLNMGNAFSHLRRTNACFASRTVNTVTMNSAGFIDVVEPISYYNMTTTEFMNMTKITTNADENHLLVINIVGDGTPWHFVGKGSTHTDPAYSLLNFVNIPSVYFDQLGANLEFSVLAPNTDAYLDDKEMHGQIVFQNLNQTDKHYIHPHNFRGIIRQ